MTNWFIDTGPLGHIAAVLRPTWRWPASTLCVVTEVKQEALNSGYKNQALLSRSDGDNKLWIAEHCIQVPSDAATMFATQLRPRQSHATKNVGEDATIALLATEYKNAIFATGDRTAAFVALAELGTGRVASPFCLYDDLRRRELIEDADFDDLCRRTARQLGQAIPGIPWRFRTL